jgi:hypothetical protein
VARVRHVWVDLVAVSIRLSQPNMG